MQALTEEAGVGHADALGRRRVFAERVAPLVRVQEGREAAGGRGSDGGAGRVKRGKLDREEGRGLQDGWPIRGFTRGCTTAATSMVHGDVVTAFVTQPFGAMIALLGMLFGIDAWMCLIRGRSFVDILVRLPFWRIVLGMFFLLLASWGYKYLIWTG